MYHKAASFEIGKIPTLYLYLNSIRRRFVRHTEGNRKTV